MGISRRGFMRNAFGTAVIGSLVDERYAWPGAVSASATDDSYLELVRANDRLVPPTVKRVNDATQRLDPRPIAGALGVIAAAFCAPESAHFRSAELFPVLAAAADRLLAAQHPDGTIDSGNYHSPPDTGFVVQGVCPALSVLRAMNLPELFQMNSKLETFPRGAGDALSVGGVHTPNHRWVVCSALAQMNESLPSTKYVGRIDDWLGEGINCDADGQFSERSTGIYSRVIDNALITVARKRRRHRLTCVRARPFCEDCRR